MRRAVRLRAAWRRRAGGSSRRLPAVLRAQAVKQPVYVGARACAQCHEGKAAGNQYSHWLAHRALEGLGLARDAGGQGDGPAVGHPRRAREGADLPRLPRHGRRRGELGAGPGFRIEDGVQCEKCHGPGSEYMDEAVMRDPEAARRAGLRRFTKRDCAVCHYVKGSHVAVHRKPPLDVEEAWQELAHPVPRGAGPAASPAVAAAAADGSRAEVRRRRRLRRLPPGPDDGLPAQPVAHEPARPGLRRRSPRRRGGGRQEDGRGRGSAGGGRVPEVPRDRRRRRGAPARGPSTSGRASAASRATAPAASTRPRPSCATGAARRRRACSRSPRRRAPPATRTRTASRSSSPRRRPIAHPTRPEPRAADAVGKRTALASRRAPATLDDAVRHGRVQGREVRSSRSSRSSTRTRSTSRSAPTGARCGSPARPRAASSSWTRRRA